MSPFEIAAGGEWAPQVSLDGRHLLLSKGNAGVETFTLFDLLRPGSAAAIPIPSPRAALSLSVRRRWTSLYYGRKQKGSADVWRTTFPRWFVCVDWAGGKIRWSHALPPRVLPPAMGGCQVGSGVAMTDQECAGRGTNEDRAMNSFARRFLVLLALGGCAVVGAACGGSLAPEPMQTGGPDGATGDAGLGSGGDRGATDAHVKADSMCQYDVDAVPASVDGGNDPCAFLVEYPADPALPVSAFRIIVDGVQLPLDPTNGWTHTDDTQRVIRIAGPVCDAIKAGTIQTIWVEFYCPGIA